MVQYGRPSRSSWTKTVRSSFDRLVMGRGKLRKSYCSTVGSRFPIGNAYSYTVKKGLFLSVYVDDIKLAGKKQNIDPMWKSTQQRSWVGRTNIFPWSCVPGMYSKTLSNKQRYCWQLPNHVWIQNFRRSEQRNYHSPQNLRISSWSYDMEGHAKQCVERFCELANKTTQQLYKLSSPCLDDHHFKEEELKSVGELSKVCSQIDHHFKEEELKSVGELSKVCSNCSEMPILGTYWKTRYSLVSEQTCTINYKMVQSMWQTPESIDFIYSSHMWIQTILSCG